MTNDGFERLLTLFKDDIQGVKFDVDGIESAILAQDLIFNISGSNIIITGTIPADVVGYIDNFKIYGPVIYDVRTNLQFTKINNKSVVFNIPYSLENKVVS